MAGYLLKDIKGQELAQAIRRVYHGELVIDERLTPTAQGVQGELEYGLAEGDDSVILVKEVQLVIPPPVDAARLLRFVYQVEEALEVTIVQQVGSWDRGTAITVLLPWATPLMDILDALGEMRDVESVTEKPAAKYKSFSFPEQIIATPETRLRREIFITLKPADTAKQLELAGPGTS